ncbi:PEPxxWA-CTERM sorting domain-containing protein [Sandaracinobacter sp. RS1-74]|uniref:PEPxxWA-CTERM sorting domain-containing protein n=1 Tax=Sandaracinobacteroides sayramensis TaxID=2913411 RepID=UPI001EDC46E5|nr:PEPxxWA-CTERM sorting domain-containing protein [Sandaracinobacteroides sayramensis]MCG2841912.1 PEPxxWA-CTERM sorting domain-containing protein [Sandaracinobacteroides sayramensis]
MHKFLLAVAALAVAGSAHAAVSITSAAYDAALAPGEKLVVTFDAPAADGFSITGGHVRTGSASNAAAPYGDTTAYMYVLGGQSATLTTPLLKSFSIYIGSVDSYNHITFKGANGYSETISGSQLVALANGNQSSAGTNRRFYFDFGADRVNEVIFSSTSNSFEFDNIAAGAVPEPATWAMLILGFGMVGAAMRRRASTLASVTA